MVGNTYICTMVYFYCVGGGNTEGIHMNSFCKRVLNLLVELFANLCLELVCKVVKIAFWLIKSYDFTSQNMLYVLNRLKKSKMDKIGLKSGEIVKIRWNHAKSWFQDWFCDCAKMSCWNKIPPSCPAVRRLLDVSCTVTDSRDSLHFRELIHCLQSSQITTHKILFPTEQIPNRQQQKRRQRSPSSTKAASDSAHGPVTPVFTPSLSLVLTVAASFSVYRDFNSDEPTTISSTAHGFELPLQSSLTAARRQRSPFFPIFNSSRRHRASSPAAVQLIIIIFNSSRRHRKFILPSSSSLQ